MLHALRDLLPRTLFPLFLCALSVGGFAPCTAESPEQPEETSIEAAADDSQIEKKASSTQTEDSVYTIDPQGIMPTAQSAKEIERLQDNLKELQKNIATLQGNITPKADEGASTKPFVKTYVSLFVDLLEERLIQLQKGLNDIGESLLNLVARQDAFAVFLDVATFFTVLLGIISLGVVGGLLAHRWLIQGLSGIFRWALGELKEKPRLRQTASIVMSLISSVLPVLVMFLIQVSIAYAVQDTPFIHNVIYIVALGLLVWLGVWRCHTVFLQFIPNDFWGSGSTRLKRSLGFYLQIFLFFWIVDDWLVASLSFVGLSAEVNVLVTSVFGLGMTVGALLIVHTLKSPILKWIKLNQNNQFPLLTTFFWIFWNTFPAILYLMFFLDAETFYQFFYPLLMTLFFFPLIPIVNRTLKQLRITYLLSRRKTPQQGVLFRFLKPRVRTHRLCYLFSYIFVGVLFVEVWDFRVFQSLKFFVGGQLYDQLFDVVLLLFGAWVCVHFGDRILNYYLGRPPATHNEDDVFYITGRMRTLLMTSRTILRIVVAIVFGLIILSALGYNIVPIVNNLGFFTLAFGWGIQSFVKDFFAGLFSLLDNNVAVGDWVDVDGRLGIVEELTLRTIKVRSDAGTLFTIPFGSINVLGNRSRHFSRFLVNLPVPYETDPDQVQKLMDQAYQNLKKQSNYRKKILGPIQIRGINDISDYAFVYQARVQTAPTTQEFVRRGYNRQLKILLDEAGIKPPAPSYAVLKDTLTTVSGRMFAKT